jgi:hypothetical protein
MPLSKLAFNWTFNFLMTFRPPTTINLVAKVCDFKVVDLILLAVHYQHRQVPACSQSVSAFRDSEGWVVLCYDTTRNNVLSYTVLHCGSERIKWQQITIFIGINRMPVSVSCDHELMGQWYVFLNKFQERGMSHFNSFYYTLNNGMAKWSTLDLEFWRARIVLRKTYL